MQTEAAFKEFYFPANLDKVCSVAASYRSVSSRLSSFWWSHFERRFCLQGLCLYSMTLTFSRYICSPSSSFKVDWDSKYWLFSIDPEKLFWMKNHDVLLILVKEVSFWLEVNFIFLVIWHFFNFLYAFWEAVEWICASFDLQNGLAVPTVSQYF